MIAATTANHHHHHQPAAAPPPPQQPHADAFAVQRAQLVRWLIHANAATPALAFAPETVYAAVAYLDTVLAAHRLADPAQYPLLAAACLWVAAKYCEEYIAPDAAGVLAAFPKGAWTRADVLKMERVVLQAMQYELRRVAPSQAVFEALLEDKEAAAAVAAAVAASTIVEVAAAPAHEQRRASSCASTHAAAAATATQCPPSPPLTPSTPSSVAAAPAHARTDTNEHWPAHVATAAHRAALVKVVRAVQTDVVQSLLMHPQGTSVCPRAAAAALLPRAIAAAADGAALPAQAAGVCARFAAQYAGDARAAAVVRACFAARR